MQTFSDQVWIEVIKTALSLLLLAIGWFIGQRILASWDIKKKRRELDIAIATQFHKIYGEFKEVSRLWRAFKYPKKKLSYPKSLPLELQKRVATAEGELEAIIVKLAAERELEDDEKETLGLFRQAYQKLREAIRGDENLDWTHNKPESKLFNSLASKTAYLIFSKEAKKHPQAADAAKALQKITSYRPEAWDDAVEQMTPRADGRRGSNTMTLPSQYFRAGAGAVIVNPHGLVLALERADIPGAWQLPQGGLEGSEEPLQAAFREVAEETGIPEGELELLQRYPEPLVYELPVSARREKTGRGQVQYWFLFKFCGTDKIIDLKGSNEFCSWKWTPITVLLDSVAEFRKPTYQRLAEQFMPYLESLVTEARIIKSDSA